MIEELAIEEIQNTANKYITRKDFKKYARYKHTGNSPFSDRTSVSECFVLDVLKLEEMTKC